MWTDRSDFKPNIEQVVMSPGTVPSWEVWLYMVSEQTKGLRLRLVRSAIGARTAVDVSNSSHNAYQEISVLSCMTMPTQPGPRAASVECHVSRVRGHAASAGIWCLRAHVVLLL